MRRLAVSMAEGRVLSAGFMGVCKTCRARSEVLRRNDDPRLIDKFVSKHQGHADAFVAVIRSVDRPPYQSFTKETT
jgi:hypothetical protein